MRSFRILRSTAVTAIAVSALVACSSTQDKGSGSDGTPIKLGAPIAQSGAFGGPGKDILVGANIAVREINDAGGLLGRKVELVARDTQSAPDVAVTAAQKLVENDRVVALLAPITSAEALAVSTAVSKPLKVPMMINSANTDALTISDFHKYVFAVGPNALMESKAQAAALGQSGARRWAVLASDYEGGHANAEAFKKYIKHENPDAEIVAEVYPPLAAKDYTTYINRALAKDPDYVIGMLAGSDLLTFTKQANALGFFDKVPFTSLYDATILKALGAEAPVGVRGYGRAPFFALTNDIAKNFIAAYREETGSYPADWSFLGYDAVKAWAAGVQDADSTDADKVVAALEQLTFSSTRGDMTFREIDHQGNAPEYYYTITAPSKEFDDLPIGESVTVIEGETIMPTPDEVNQLRSKK